MYEWKLPSHKPDNHWFNNLVHCEAGAAYEGITDQYTTPPREEKKEVVFSEIQKQRRRERGTVGVA